MTLSYKILDNGVTRDATVEERAEIDALQKTEINVKERKLSYIRDIRNEINNIIMNFSFVFSNNEVQ